MFILEQIQENLAKRGIDHTRHLMFQEAFDMIMADLEAANYNLDGMEFSCNSINYSAFCERLEWPDFQDGGIFEQMIEAACKAALTILGLRPNY